MIPFKGRSSMKQYVLLKSVKCGLKVWAMADSLNGYLYDFNVYTGASGGDRETGLGEKVVLQLVESIKGNNHHLYFDNYFSSSLLSKLWKMVHMHVEPYVPIASSIPPRSVMRPNDLTVVSPPSASVVTS